MCWNHLIAPHFHPKSQYNPTTKQLVLDEEIVELLLAELDNNKAVTA